MKRFLPLLGLIFIAATSNVPNPITNGKLTTDLDANGKKILNLDTSNISLGVPSTRTIATTSPLLGGGDLSANRTLSIQVANTTQAGYLTASDWNLFNSKEPAISSGNTFQFWRGDKTWQPFPFIPTIDIAGNLLKGDGNRNAVDSGITPSNVALLNANNAFTGVNTININGTVGATTPAAGTFTTLTANTSVTTPIIKPSADSTTALQVTKANGTTVLENWDSTNTRKTIGSTGNTNYVGTLNVAGASQAYKGNIVIVDTAFASSNASADPTITGWGSDIGGTSTGRMWFMGMSGASPNNVAFGGSTNVALDFYANNAQIGRWHPSSGLYLGTSTFTDPGAGSLIASGGVTFGTSLKSTTALATPSSLSTTQFTGFASTVSGAAIMGMGTTGDVTLKNRAGTDALIVGPNTTLVTIPGTLAVTGASTLTGGATIGNNLTVAGTIDSIGTPQSVSLTSDATTASTTYTDVSGMSFSMAANKNYSVMICLVTNKNDANGLRVQLTGPASPKVVSLRNIASTSSFSTNVADYWSAFSTESTTFNTVSGDAFYYSNEGMISNGANAGTVQLQFKTITGGTAKIYAGSWIRITKLN